MVAEYFNPESPLSDETSGVGKVPLALTAKRLGPFGEEACVNYIKLLNLSCQILKKRLSLSIKKRLCS